MILAPGENVLADASLNRQTCQVFKLVVGILKGAINGGALGYGLPAAVGAALGALGYGAFALKEATDVANPWITYGAIGALVGLITGRAIWSLLRDKNATAWESILRAAAGFGLGCGLYALLAKVWNPAPLVVEGYDLFTWQTSVGAAIGVIGGLLFEVDAIGDDKKPAAEPGRPGPSPAPAAKKPAPKR